MAVDIQGELCFNVGEELKRQEHFMLDGNKGGIPSLLEIKKDLYPYSKETVLEIRDLIETIDSLDDGLIEYIVDCFKK